MTMTTFARPTLRRRTAFALAGVLALTALPSLAAYPDQPVKLIVGFPPGGGGDLYGRLIAGALSKTLGQNVIVDNRTGAGGNIAADLVAKSKPDGYTLLLAMSGNLAVAPAIKPQSIPYKVPDDLRAHRHDPRGATMVFSWPTTPLSRPPANCSMRPRHASSASLRRARALPPTLAWRW